MTRLLREWSTILGEDPRLEAEQPGRELWPVTAVDGRGYFLKRLGPWRNLPVADQARVLRYLTTEGVRVAEFTITDAAQLFAGEVEDSFVLLPAIEHLSIAGEGVDTERVAGAAVARLHIALSRYPWSANSYQEQFASTLLGPLLLPKDLLVSLTATRDDLAAALTCLPLQLVHGDLTPDNVLLAPDGRSAGFIDLDHLPLAPRMWDVGKYLSRRLRGDSPGSALAGVSAFVAGYHAVSPLSSNEQHAIPAAVAAMNMIEIDWTAQILSGDLQRRLLPEQEAELSRAVLAIRWQLDDPQLLPAAVQAGVG